MPAIILKDGQMYRHSSLMIALAATLIAALLVGCGATTTASPVASTTVTSRSAPGIVDPTNHGWPRLVEVANGQIQIKSRPMQIHTLSVGYDEITLAIVDPSRVAAVGSFAANPAYSNIADLAGEIANKLGRDAEQIISAGPDLVVASKFSKQELIELLEQAGITVAQTDLARSVDAYEDNIRLLAYMYGEEERGEELVADVRDRLRVITDITEARAESDRPTVMFLSGRGRTPGGGTIQDGIIAAAGGVNVAAKAGLTRETEISLEVIADYAPEYIFVYSTVEGEMESQRTEVTAHPALAEVPAIKNGRVFGVRWTYFNTLSHWNIRGVEELAKILWPKDFGDMEFGDFEYDVD